MTTFVFLGPSLPLDRAQELIDAVFLPPVAMGDLYVLLKNKAKPGDTIAVIDGLFEQVAALWHKEILQALSSGVHVYGASSMGALRAAELYPFGMAGVGRIFAAYRDGQLTDDDDVAVAHAQADGGYKSLSVAMASLRFAFEDMNEAGVISLPERDSLISFAKSLPYAERSWGSILQYVRENDFSSDCIGVIRAEAGKPDTKARDAELLLRELASSTAEQTEPFIADFCFNRTSYWAMLEYEMYPRTAHVEAINASDQALADAVRTHSPHRRQIEEEAAILEISARRSSAWQPDKAAMRAAAANLAHRHGLIDKEGVRAWREKQGIDEEAWVRLVAHEARRDRLLTELRPSLHPYLAMASQRTGLAATIRAELDSIEYDQAGGQRLKRSLEEEAVDVGALQQWYTARCGSMLPDPETHALQLGFPTLRDFVTAMTPAFLASTSAKAPPLDPDNAGD